MKVTANYNCKIIGYFFLFSGMLRYDKFHCLSTVEMSHFTDKEIEIQRENNLPKVTELVNGTTGTQI